MTLPKIKMERPSVYNGLDWLVALDEGLFTKEGLEVELIAHGGEQETNVKVSDWNQVASNRGHAEAVERGRANIFNACEWGNYRRSQDYRGRMPPTGEARVNRRRRRGCSTRFRHLHAAAIGQ